MINSTNLANRLNNFRNGDEVPLPEPEEFNDTIEFAMDKGLDDNLSATASDEKEPISNYDNIWYQIGLRAGFFIKSAIYGYSLNVIVDATWPIHSYLIIGLAVEILTSRIFSLFDKKD